jgi:putative transposase
MKLASSSYYYQPLTDLQAQEQSDALLRAHIERLQQHFPGYGYRRLSRQLRREGIVVNDKKIRRVQEIPAISHPLAHFQDCHHRLESQPQGLSQSAGREDLDRNHQAWVADITYIRILKGFVFLAAILDRYSRKVIGWAISQRIDAELCVAALRIALEQRQPPPG